MYEIAELVSNIQKYGNCKVYFYDNGFPNENDTIIFRCTEDRIDMVEQTETYEGIPRWDGKELRPVEPIAVKDDKRNPFLYNIAFVIASFFSLHKVVITCEAKNDGRTFDTQAATLTQFILRMLADLKKADYDEIIVTGVDFMPENLIKIANRRRKMKLQSSDTDYGAQVASLMDSFIANSNGQTDYLYRFSLICKELNEKFGKSNTRQRRKRIRYIPDDDDD